MKEHLHQRIAALEEEIVRLKDTNNLLAESEQLLRILTEKSFAGIYIVQDGRFKFVNANTARFAGYRPTDLIGKKADIILHPEDKERVKTEARAMLKEMSISPYEFRILTRKRGYRWMLETVAPIHYQGRPAILGYSMDITDRKIAEEALRESERRLSDIIEFLPDATFAVDQKGKVIAWNRAIEEMTRVKVTEMMGKCDYEYALPFYGERRPLIIDLVLKPEKAVEKTYLVFDRKGGHVFAETWAPCLNLFLWGKASPLYDSQGTIAGAIETIRDITDRKHAEDVLRKRERDLEVKTGQLEDLNAALRVLLKQREDDKSELEEKVLSNIKRLVFPHLEKLRLECVGTKATAYLGTVESNLKDIVSPFARKLSSQYLNLTNREVQVAALIKEGRTTKEIANLLNASESVVNIHRFNIRRKLGLTKKHNLHTYLASFM